MVSVRPSVRLSVPRPAQQTTSATSRLVYLYLPRHCACAMDRGMRHRRVYTFTAGKPVLTWAPTAAGRGMVEEGFPGLSIVDGSGGAGGG